MICVSQWGLLSPTEKGKVVMKKIVIIVMGVLLTLAIGVVTVFASEYIKEKKNEKNLDVLMDVFLSTISEFSGSDIIESKSVYGKLNGNGNGIQYFGIALIHKDSIKDIDSLVAKLDTQFEIVDYCIQEKSEISSKYLEHRKLKYDTNIYDEIEYISISFFNTKHPDSDFLDEAGH